MYSSKENDKILAYYKKLNLCALVCYEQISKFYMNNFTKVYILKVNIVLNITINIEVHL